MAEELRCKNCNKPVEYEIPCAYCGRVHHEFMVCKNCGEKMRPSENPSDYDGLVICKCGSYVDTYFTVTPAEHEKRLQCRKTAKKATSFYEFGNRYFTCHLPNGKKITNLSGLSGNGCGGCPYRWKPIRSEEGRT